MDTIMRCIDHHHELTHTVYVYMHFIIQIISIFVILLCFCKLQIQTSCVVQDTIAQELIIMANLHKYFASVIYIDHCIWMMYSVHFVICYMLVTYGSGKRMVTETRAGSRKNAINFKRRFLPYHSATILGVHIGLSYLVFTLTLWIGLCPMKRCSGVCYFDEVSVIYRPARAVFR